MFVEKSFLSFTQQLYKNICKEYGGRNCFVSPLSIYSALCLALCGSATSSRNELLTALSLKQDDSDDFESTLTLTGKYLKAILEGDTNKTMVLANGLFLEAHFEAGSDFTNDLKQCFDVSFHTVNFQTPEVARGEINHWVKEHTCEKIPNLMPRGSIENSTRLVLANAIYFKGTWETVFVRDLTRERPFHTLTGEVVNVPMMFASNAYKAAIFPSLKASALRIPFRIHEMLVVLPDAKDGLPQVLRALADPKRGEEHFQNLFDSAQYHQARFDLHLPRFKLGGGSSMDLKEPLGGMGMKDVFHQSGADFSRITQKESLHISKIFHQAVIEVDEEGAEAAGATGIAIAAMCLPPSFTVDHPFLFFIVTATGVPAFMGHVTNPLG